MIALFPGGWEWVVIAFIALLFFGPRLPSVMRSVGRSITEFKKGLKEGEDELKRPVDEDEKHKLEG